MFSLSVQWYRIGSRKSLFKSWRMRIVACGTIEHHPLTGPIGNSFAMRATEPVSFLAKMALTAELVAMVEIDFSALFILQKISFFDMVAIYTAQSLPFLAVF